MTMHLEEYCRIIRSKTFASLELSETAVAAYHLHLMHFTHLVHIQFCIVNKKHSEQWRGICPVSWAESGWTEKRPRKRSDFAWYQVGAQRMELSAQSFVNHLQAFLIWSFCTRVWIGRMFCDVLWITIFKFTIVFVRRKWYFLSCQADCINSNDQGVHSTESCRRDFLDAGKTTWNQFDHGKTSSIQCLVKFSLFVFFGGSTTDNFGWRESHNSWFLAGTSTIWWYKVRWGRAKVVSSVDPD